MVDRFHVQKSELISLIELFVTLINILQKVSETISWEIKRISSMCSVYAHFEKELFKINFNLIHVSVLMYFLHDTWCL